MERFKVVMEGGRDDGGIFIHQVYIAEANLSGGVRLRRLVGRESMVLEAGDSVEWLCSIGSQEWTNHSWFSYIENFFIVRV